MIFCFSQCIIIPGTLCWFVLFLMILTFDHLFNVVSVKFSHCNFIYLLFENNGYSWGDTLRLSTACYYSNSNSVVSTIWWTVVGFVNIMMVAAWLLSNPIIPSSCDILIQTKRAFISLSFIYVFICLPQFVFLHS